MKVEEGGGISMSEKEFVCMSHKDMVLQKEGAFCVVEDCEEKAWLLERESFQF
jgi:hypothetical protein